MNAGTGNIYGGLPAANFRFNPDAPETRSVERLLISYATLPEAAKMVRHFPDARNVGGQLSERGCGRIQVWERIGQRGRVPVLAVDVNALHMLNGAQPEFLQ